LAEEEPAAAGKNETPAPAASNEPLRLSDRHLQNILGALEEETAFQFEGAGVPDVIDYFAEKHKVNIRIDYNAVKAIEFPDDATYSAAMAKISLRAALGIICRDMGLAFMIRDECLWLTSPLAAAQNPRTYSYNISPLLIDDPAGNRLISSIESVLPVPAAPPRSLDLHQATPEIPARTMRVAGGLLLVRADEASHNAITSILIRMLEDSQERARAAAAEAAIRAFQQNPDTPGLPTGPFPRSN